MALEIRPVCHEDYVALAEVATAAWMGQPHSAEELEEEDNESKPPCKHGRWVAVLDGHLVGNTSYWQSPSRYHPQKFWMDLFVHPDLQGKGIGEALYHKLMAELKPYDPIQVRTFTREDIPRSGRFFGERGFAEGKRTWESFLDVATFDFSPYDGVVEQVLAQGITMHTLAEVKNRPGWEEAFLDLLNAIQADVPDIDPAVPINHEQFMYSYVEKAQDRPDSRFFALDGDRWVGYHALGDAPAEPSQLDNGLTGIRREYRGRKIALAMKLVGIKYAKEHGFARIRTTNASTNKPMLSINQRLGFKFEPAWLHLVKGI